MLKIAIVDDDVENLERMKSYAERYREESGALLTVMTFQMGIDFLTDYGDGFDIIFMDIKMPLMDGVAVARQLRERDKLSCIIFVTSFAQYAIEGYSVNALDFMVKPVAYETFAQKLRKAIRFQEKYAEQFYYIHTEDGLVKMKLADILYVESQGHSVYFYKKDGALRSIASLKDIERELENKNFCRCHASFLVNMEHITQFKGNKLILTGGGISVPISRGRKEEFMNSFTKFLGGKIL